MNRVEVLFNSSFDFGKDYKGNAANTVNGSGGNTVTYPQTDQSGAPIFD